MRLFERLYDLIWGGSRVVAQPLVLKPLKELEVRLRNPILEELRADFECLRCHF